MEEYSQYSSSWMWNMHQREEDYVYSGAGGNDGSSGPSNVGEDFGNSLDQLNKIVERIAPDGRGPLPKKDMNSRRMSLDESHFNDNVYETFLGYGNNGANEMLGDYPAHVSGYEGSGWNPTTCEPYLGIAFSGMSDRRVEKFDSMEPGNHLENKHELIECKRETFSEKESGVSKLTLVSNSEQRPGQSFEKLRSSKNFDEFEGNRVYTKTKHRAAKGGDSPGTKHFESLSLDRHDEKQRMQSPEWSNSKQLLEIGKYTESGGKNTDTTSPHNSVGHLTNYGESSMNYDSLSSLSMGGNVAYVSPAEHTMSDCTDTKMDEDPKLYTCSQCSYRAVKKGQLRKHMSVHGLFLCAHCEFSSEHGDGLETHRRTHHPGLCGRKLCKKCRVLYQGDELKEHERLCSGEKQRWPCMTCNKEFKFLSVMKAHVRKWHPSVTVSLVGDPTLGDGFPPVADSTTEEVAGGSDVESEQGVLAKSVLEAELESGFRCNDCDKVFKSRWMLSNHRVLHCTDVPFFCDTNGCSTTFRSDKELNVHRMKVHELGPKKYPCCHPDCSMQFAKYGHYKRHKLTHIVGERKFKCDWPNCGKAFSHTDNLKVHYRRHTDEKPYKCQHCESAYRQKSGLKYHLEKVHDERSTGRPGRKRKSIGPPEGEPERPGMMRADNFMAADCEGCDYDYPVVSRALNSSDGGSRKTVGNSVAIKLFVKKPRLASRDGDFVEINKTPAPRKQEIETDIKMESEGEGDHVLTSGEITSVSSAKPNPGASARLGEIGLNDEWVIDEQPFSEVDVKKEKEEKLEKLQVVDSSSDFRCTSPKIEPLDVDLGEELRRLSDVISGEIRTTHCADHEASSVNPANVHGLSEFLSNDHMTIQQGGSDAYLHRFAVPLHGSYRHHADLFRETPSQADDLDLYATGKYRVSLNNQPYNQFCRSSASSDKVPEMGSYSASGYTCQPHPSPLKLRLATSTDPLCASGHQMAYNDSGARVWLPSDAGGLDDGSPASGQSTRSDLSLSNSGDIADHYREAHTALLPTSSPIIQHQASANDEMSGAVAYVERPESRTRPLPSSWSHSFQEEEEEEEEEEDDREEEEEEEEEDDVGGEERWPDQCNDWCQPPFSDRPMSSKGNVDLPLVQVEGTSTSAALPMSSYSTNQAPLIWPADKSHESAFSHRMQGVGAGYGVSPSTRPSGWSVEDGTAFGYRPRGDPFVGNGSTTTKRTSTYGVLRDADKFSPGMALRDEAYEAARDPNYYSALHRPAPPADPLMYRYYGPGGNHPHHQYGQAGAAAFDLQGSGRSWVGLAPEDTGFLPMASSARGSVQSPVYPSPLMLYPTMPPYF